MKKLIVIAAMLTGITAAQAQEDNNILNHLGVGVEVGTTGIGFELGAPITDYVQVRAGMSFMPSFKVKDINVDVDMNQDAWNGTSGVRTQLEKFSNVRYADGSSLSAADQSVVKRVADHNDFLPTNVMVDGKLKFTNFKFLVDVFPIKSSSFHATVGFYAGSANVVDLVTTSDPDDMQLVADYNASGLVNQTLKGDFVYNGQTVTQSFTMPGKLQGKIGNGSKVVAPEGSTMCGYVKTSAFRPYVGVGFGRVVPKKTRLAFACDLGVMFWGTPKIYINQSAGDVEITKDDVDNNTIKNLSKLTVYPCLNFRLTGKIF